MSEAYRIENISKDPNARLFRAAQAKPSQRVLHLPQLRILPGRSVTVPFSYVEAYAVPISEACKTRTIRVRKEGTETDVDMDAFLASIVAAYADADMVASMAEPVPVKEEAPPVVEEVQAVVAQPPVAAQVASVKEEEPVAAAPAVEIEVSQKETVGFLMSLKRPKLEELLKERGLPAAKPTEDKLTLANRVLAR